MYLRRLVDKTQRIPIFLKKILSIVYVSVCLSALPFVEIFLKKNKNENKIIEFQSLRTVLYFSTYVRTYYRPIQKGGCDWDTGPNWAILGQLE